MIDPGALRRRALRDRWLRRLRRTFLAVPVAAALGALGLTAVFARHDALKVATSVNTHSGAHTSTSSPATRTPRGGEGDDGGDDDGSNGRQPLTQPTTPTPPPTHTQAPPITNTGGS